MSAETLQTKLKSLAAKWREKSHRIKDKFGRENPNLVTHVEAALETCAQEIEELAEGK